MSRYLGTKANFLRFSILTMGSLSTALLLWNFGPWGELGWWLFLIGLGFGAGWLWGFLMWHLWAAPYFNLSNKDKDH